MWRQQKNYIQEKLLKKNATQKYIEGVDPRDVMNVDLNEFVKKIQGDNKNVILLGDMNQNMYRVQRGKVSFATLCNKRRLYTALHEHEENMVLSHKRGRAVIDHIVLGNIETTNVKEAGQLPFGVGFATLDH